MSVDGDERLRQRGLAARFLEERLDERGSDTGARLLNGSPPLLGQRGKPPSRASEFVLEHGSGMSVKRAAAHRAATAACGAGSAARTVRRAGAVSVKPENMRAIPTSSPT